MKTAALLLALVATTTLLTACGGSSSGGDNTPVTAIPKATLSVAPASIELFAGSGAPVTLTITNTSSSATATAISAALPASWSDVTQDVSGCVTLPPQSQCTLSFTSGSTSHPATAVTISGQNTEPTSATIAVSPFNGANITPLTATVLALPTGASATIVVLNSSTQLTATHITADLRGTPLLNALTQDASNCVSVAPGASCHLYLTAGNTTVTSTNFPIHGDNTNSIGGAIAIALSSSATITVANSPLILQGTTGTPTAGTLTITNTSATLTANNISADIASTALAGNVAQDASACATLLPLASCYLSFTPGAATVASTPVTIQGDNTSQVGATIAINAAPQATLNVTGSPLKLLSNGATGSITITNTSSTETALSIASDFTATALSGNVAETGNTCASLAPSASCTLTFTPGNTGVAQTTFGIAGSNTQTASAAITIQTLAIGDSYEGGIVLILPTGGNPGTIVNVLADEQALPWGGNSILVGAGASSDTDGAANTAAIVNALGAGTNYAAGYCDAYSAVDGATTYSDWYLPANQELDVLLNIDISDSLGLFYGQYWSSRELDMTDAYFRNWGSFGGTSTGGKNNFLSVRCVRSFTN